MQYLLHASPFQAELQKLTSNLQNLKFDVTIFCQ